MPHEYPASRRGPIHRARILALPNMCFHITKYTYPIRQIPAFISSNTYLTIIKHVHSFHRIRIFTSPHTHFPLHFVCVYVYAGTINRPLRLRTACQLRGEHSANTQRPPTKCLTNTPPGVGADSSRPYPNITTHTHSHHRTRISPPHYVCSRICGHDKSAPTAANGLQ